MGKDAQGKSKQYRDQLQQQTADRDTSEKTSLLNERSKFLFLLFLFLYDLVYPNSAIRGGRIAYRNDVIFRRYKNLDP